MNRLFLQFYKKEKNYYLLSNGFSDAYGYCKNIGDFIWVNSREMHNFTFPFKKGKVYISAMYLHHVVQADLWAREYQEIDFIVGGPAVQKIYDDYPKRENLNLVTSSVEDYFGIENFGYEWGLDLSNLKDELTNDNGIYFSYTIDSSCYWHNCKFCNYYFGESRTRNFSEVPLERIDFSGIKHIRLNCPSLTQKHLTKLLPTFYFQNDIIYDFLIRCDPEVYTTLGNLLDKYKQVPNLRVRLGIEYPTKRMLQFMNKGFTTEYIIEACKIISGRNNVFLCSNFILGWPNLTEEDITDLQSFFSKVPYFDSTVITRLVCFRDTFFHELFSQRKGYLSYEGNIYKGYYPKLKIEEIKINDRALEIIWNRPSTLKYDFYSSLKHFIGRLDV